MISRTLGITMMAICVVFVAYFLITINPKEHSEYQINLKNAEQASQLENNTPPVDSTDPDTTKTNSVGVQNKNAFNGVSEELLDWYFFLQPTIDPEMNMFSNHDEGYIAFRSKMREDTEAYLKLVNTGLDNPYLTLVLIEIPANKVELLLPYLTELPIFSDIAFERQLHTKHPETFEQALHSWNDEHGRPPIGLILPAIQTGNKSFLEEIQDAALNSDAKLAVFETLLSSDFKGMALALAAENWQKVNEQNPQDISFDDMYIAARFGGNKQALIDLANIYEKSRGEERVLLESNLRALVSYKVNVRELETLADSLAYNAEMHWWDTPD